MISWMQAVLQETDVGNRLVTAYIAEDQGRERQYIDFRMPVAGRKWVVSGCFDIARAADLAKPIYDALHDARVRVPRAH